MSGSECKPREAQARQRAASRNGASKKRPKQLKSVVDPHVTNLLENIGDGKTVLRFPKEAKIFSQGDAAEAIYFIQTGKVKITVVSAAGKEAVLAMLWPRGFFGEGCLVGQTLRVSTATAIKATTLFRIEGPAMLRALHSQPELSEKFTASLLARNIDLEEDLCDQLFNHSEKRLARVLLKLASALRPIRRHVGHQNAADESPDFGRNGGHHAVPHHTLYEQVQDTGPHRLQRRDHCESRITDRRGSARLNVLIARQPLSAS
jgi:CRP-like cAMP-binding protein